MDKNKLFKKGITVGLASALLASNMLMMAGHAKAETETSTDFDKVEVSNLVKDLAKETKVDRDAEFEDNQKVRVIVELEGAPAISYAQDKGVMYKELAPKTRLKLESDIKDEQKDFLANVKKQNIGLTLNNSFTTVLNGVSGEMEYGNIEKLEKLPGVLSVSIATEYERPKEKPDMVTSKEMVEAQQTWKDGYNGKGMVVGIIDTGIDFKHKDMKLTTKEGEKLSENSTNDLITKNSLPGKFYTDKVPYGYNYADKNDEVLDLGPDASMHGMHVGGTVAANGDENNGGVQGVAPEAQLLALKVFGNDPAMPSTFGDIYIKAIDDGIKLGADVLNMSLGSTAGFVDDTNLEQKAVDNAVNNGIVMSISAGNSDNISGEFDGAPLATNPDIGLVGAPSVSKSSLSVASMENNKISLDEFDIKIGDETINVPYKKQSSPDPLEVFGNKEVDVVYVGDGSPAQYNNKDVKGKVVVAVRTATNPNYGEIQAQAEKAGAAGVIVRGHVSHGDYVSMALNNPTIPLVSLAQSEGNNLAAKLQAAGGKGKVTFTGKQQSVVNTAAGKMSTFTSWGVTPSLEMKPEITAPGGQIYSTLNNDKYGLMSGTSMAAPHVSGGSALVLQRVKELFPDLKDAAKSKMAKLLLMNTAKPVEDPDNGGIYYSPRRQGAGIMQLHSAVSTPVYVAKKGTNEGKVELKEIKDDSFSFTLTATNTSDDDLEYEVKTSLLTDSVTGGKLDLKEQNIADEAKITVDTPKFTLFGNGTKDITVKVNLTNAKEKLEKLMKNGYFVEGFVRLVGTDKEKAAPELTVPFVGFKGDWNKAPILDNMIYEDGSYLETSFMVDEKGNALGENALTGDLSKNAIAISPNGDKQKDSVTPVLSFLRNSKSVEYSIVDESGKELRKLTTRGAQSKNYKATAPYVYNPSRTNWDGYIRNEKAKDGKYFYQVKTQVDYEGKEPQVTKIPVIVDTVKPEITNASFSSNKGQLYFEATDMAGSGLQYIQILVDGKNAGYLDGSKAKAFKVPVSNVKDKSTIQIVAVDNANNIASTTVTNDNTIPYIVTTSPEALGVYDTKSMAVTGYVEDASKIEELKVTGDKLEGGGIEIPVTYNKVTKRYDFNTQLTFTEDGVHDIFFSGKDSVGNKIEFRRQVIVDTTPAELKVEGIPDNNIVGKDEENPTLKITASDNYDDLRLVVDGNEVYNHEFDEPYEMRALSHSYDYKLDLKAGSNKVVVEATDLSGHVTKKTIVIYKGDQPKSRFITNYDFGPTKEVSTENPATLTAEANESVKWVATVTDPTGKVVDLEPGEGKEYTSTFTPDEFAPNGEYKLKFGPEGSDEKQEVTFTVANYPIVIEGQTKNTKGKAVEAVTEDGVLNIVANFANRGEVKQNAQVLVQVKDSKDEVVIFKVLSLDKFKKASRGSVGVDIPLESLKSGAYTAEVFVWDSLENPTPLAQTSTINFDIK